MTALACQVARPLHRLGAHMRELGEGGVAVTAGKGIGVEGAGDSEYHPEAVLHHRVVVDLFEPLTLATPEILSLRRGILLALARGITYILHRSPFETARALNGGGHFFVTVRASRSRFSPTLLLGAGQAGKPNGADRGGAMTPVSAIL